MLYSAVQVVMANLHVDKCSTAESARVSSWERGMRELEGTEGCQRIDVREMHTSARVGVDLRTRERRMKKRPETIGTVAQRKEGRVTRVNRHRSRDIKKRILECPNLRSRSREWGDK